MPLHILKLIKRREISRDTHLFEFTKPEGLDYKPGQYGGFTLINPSETDPGGITRRFSILSAPSDNTLQFATRIQKSAYKRVLYSLEAGAEIKFAGPVGNFTLHDDLSIPAVFLAGGIGITPFYSMIRDATLKKSSQEIVLFYGNNSLQDTALLNELQQYEKENPHFKMIVTMANANAEWQGEKGFITHVMLKNYLLDFQTPFYYICGSPAMVTALQETLAEMGIDEINRIKTEDFPGY